MSREAMLDRIRAAARAGRAFRVDVGEIPAGAGYVGAADDRCAAMSREVDEAGGTAHVVASREAARRTLAGLLDHHQPKSALCWRHPVLQRIGLDDLLQARNVRAHDYETLAALNATAQREAMLEADIGITSVDYAIAETGTLMVCCGQGQERLASLLPPVHVAVVHESQIVPDLFDAIEILRAKGQDALPSNVTLITGPSKTGDIELKLTRGVHGPKHWHVIIVRDHPEK